MRSVKTPLEATDLLILSPPERPSLHKNKNPARLCPGHLRAEVWEEIPASFALVEVENGEIKIHFLGLDAQVLSEAMLL